MQACDLSSGLLSNHSGLAGTLFSDDLSHTLPKQHIVD
ncbi:hypothetical protein HMPREF1051_2791 [Neisseria sicca VK64]|uniref:Uncharacterized protein n=1 Tax=Neisseria sicca VK64 TaxID=1095748 RepID=I2NUV4_NEISI|nr:hypothetical protein HMPREF1051_2791 [Neisseria sicca VK64]